MFGVKYNRIKFWIISICLLILSGMLGMLAQVYEEAGQYKDASITYNIIIFFSLVWINTLANRIRDYGANPWLSLFGLIPLVNIIIALFYGISKYGNKNSLETKNKPEQTGAMVDDDVYEQIMLEIEDNKKIKSTWARALSESDGDKDKAVSIYIKYRTEKIAKEQAKLKQEEAERINKLQEEEDLDDFRVGQKALLYIFTFIVIIILINKAISAL